MTADISVVQAKADLQFHQGIYNADKLIEAWDVEFARTSQLAFYIGRSKHYAGELAEALDWYEESTRRSPVFAWTYFERSAIREEAGAIAELGADLLAFLKIMGDEHQEWQLNADHARAILRRGHLVFETDVQLSRQIYAAALRVNVSDYLSLLRIIEGLLDKGLLAEAESLAAVLRARFTPDAFGLLALSRLLQAQGKAAEAAQSVVEAASMLPEHSWLRGQACARLIEIGDYAKADAEIAAFARDTRLDRRDVARVLPTLQIRSAIHRRDIPAALRVLSDPAHLWPSVESWVYAEALYKFARFGQSWTADETTLIALLQSYLMQLFETDKSACLAVLHYHSARSEWAEARRLIDTVRHLPIFESRDMVIRRFEVACQLQDLEEARAIYATRWQNDPSPNLSELALSMRFLSELKDWPAAADVAAQIVERRLSLPDDTYGILQIVRRAGQHQRFTDLLDRTARTDAFARQLRQLLVDDLCIIRGVETIGADGHAQAISRDNAILVKAADDLAPGTGRPAGFICSDRAYFVSVLTLLASLAPHAGRIADWYLFLSEDVPAAWLDMLQDFCARLDFNLTLVPEEEFFVRSEGCPTDYGMFSGGRNLARSAYFRIYAADWLLRKGTYRRAVYMDSDIVCQTRLDDLFGMEMEGAPLAARPEEYGIAVVKAASKCGVEPEDYINSGVLVFNFEHPELGEHLQDAIWQSENAGSRLTFHDQCALNIAFAGQIRHLPDRFNTFLRPFKTYDEELQNGVLLHYLDRPKPWDTGFVSSHRQPWLMAAAIVKALAIPDVFQEIVAAGIGQKVVRSPA